MSHRPRNQNAQRLARELARVDGIPYTQALARVRAVAAQASLLPTVNWDAVAWSEFVAENPKDPRSKGILKRGTTWPCGTCAGKAWPRTK